jgi:hypothetical protein
VKSIKVILLMVSCFCLSVTIGCSVAKLKSDQVSSSPTPSSQHDSGPTAGRSDSPSTGNEKQSASAATGNEIVDDLHSPAKGSDERQAIMDALREEFTSPKGSYYHPHRGAITFVVNRLQVHNGWSWMYGYPHSSDPKDSFGEYSGFLLHIQDGHWALMTLPPMVDDPNDPEKLDYPSRKDVEKIRQKFPTAPIDIFTK